jgi:Protein of unknown function (DUF4238)
VVNNSARVLVNFYLREYTRFQMDKTKSQHYVPQAYLKRFTDDGKHLWTHDTVERKRIRSHVRNIASSRSSMTCLARLKLKLVVHNH